MQESNPLIRTKLQRPFTRKGLVSRRRLQDQIEQGLLGPLTLITAPAGFGKTTLISSCLVGIGMTTAWLSLDKNDNHHGRFVSYLLASLHAADDSIGNEAAQLLKGAQQSGPETITGAVVENTAEAEQAQQKLDTVTVLNGETRRRHVTPQRFRPGRCPN